MGRNVHVKANGGAPVTLENWEGITYNDLKAALPDVSFVGQRVQIRGAMTDLVDGDALIPLDGEVFIFSTPAKMNAGGYSDDFAYAKSQYNASPEGKVHFAGYNSVKAAVLSQLVLSWDSTTSEAAGSTVGDTPEMQAVQEALAGVTSAVENLAQVILSQVSNTLGGVTLDAINAEFDAFVEKTKASSNILGK